MPIHPDPPFTVVLVEPKIPPNTGNIARLCAATGCRLVLLGELGFSIDDARVRRAGLDYWPSVDIRHIGDVRGYLAGIPAGMGWMFSTHAEQTLWKASFIRGGYLIFGNEVAGLGQELMQSLPLPTVRLPQRNEAVRSLNLGNAVSVAVYEALRQVGEPLE